MTVTANPEDTHQYVTDAEGNRKYVLLPIEEYEALLEDLRDIQLVQRRGGETISLRELKHQLGRE